MPQPIWPSPGSTPDSLAEGARRNELTADFLTRHRLSVYRWGPGNLRKVLAGGGAAPATVRHTLVEFFLEGHGIPGLFDHPLVLGRAGKPLLLLGHPYGTVAEVRYVHGDCIRALERLGVPVRFLPPAESLYGFGTIQVRVGRLDT